MQIDTNKYIPLSTAVKDFGFSKQYIRFMVKKGHIETINPYNLKIGVLYSVDDLKKISSQLPVDKR